MGNYCNLRIFRENEPVFFVILCPFGRYTTREFFSEGPAFKKALAKSWFSGKFSGEGPAFKKALAKSWFFADFFQGD
ncbi:MAG: hypothetical protein R6U86_00250 [Bacteroidales bacterium]